MITADPHLCAVLEHYPLACRPRGGTLEFLGSAGGFSGALFWRFQSAAGALLLRRWPREHPTVDRLQFIQAVLWHVHQEGFHLAPLPLETIRHAGYVQHAGHLWELTPWMSGKADYHEEPSPRRLRVGMQALAQFHRAAASFPLPDPVEAPSPGLCQRWEQLHELQSCGLDRVRRSIQPAVWPELADRATRILDMFSRAVPRTGSTLNLARTRSVPLTPCIRDIWHDHVLFAGDEVTALIDFGALRPENVAADVSRLLGSLVADDEQGWKDGLAAYEQVNPLSRVERELVTAFDESTVLLSSLNWLQWVFLEGRDFEARATILQRVDANLARLTRLAGV